MSPSDRPDEPGSGEDGRSYPGAAPGGGEAVPKAPTSPLGPHRPSPAEPGPDAGLGEVELPATVASGTVPATVEKAGEMVGERPAGSTALVVRTEEVGPEKVSTEMLRERSGVGVFRLSARSANTLLAYRRDWDRFTRWCARQGVSALPAEPGVVASYLADAANATAETGRSTPWAYSPATLERWASTINKAHDLAGLRAPGKDAEVRDTLAGVRQARATPPARKTPLLLADLERILEHLEVQAWPKAPGGIRNRCLLVMGWVGAFRRSELVALTVSDVTLHPEDGLHVLVRQSKTDQTAQGRTYGLPYGRKPLLCAPCAFLRWRNVVAGWEGTDGGPGGRAGVMRTTRADDPDRHICRTSQTVAPPGAARSERVFRAVRANGTLGGPIDGHTINAVVKAAAETTGFDPDRIGGHSLRAGFVTQAFRSGATAHAIMRQTGHRDPKTLEIYARETAPLVGNAVTQLGL